MGALLIGMAALRMIAADPPAVAGDDPTPVSELVIEARKATPVSEVVVESCAMPADSESYDTRWKRPVANAQFDASPNPDRGGKESAGTREFILRNIIGFRQGTADFAHMSEALARITRDNIKVERRWIVCRGAFRDIRFLHVSRNGFDDFEVDFSGAAIEWEVQPLDAKQMTDHWAARFYYPEPMTGRLNALINSMEIGWPDYRRVSATFAPVLRARWPTLARAFKAWRGAHSIVFLRRDEDGAYTYKLAYKNRSVIWKVGPLDAAGKITSLTYDEGG